MSWPSQSSQLGKTTLVLTPELLSRFGECDSILHTPFSPGDKVRRCGTCGRIIRAELITGTDCPYAQTRHTFQPVPVLTAEDVKPLRLRHESSAERRKPREEPDPRTFNDALGTAIDRLNSALLWASALGLIALLVFMFSKGLEPQDSILSVGGAVTQALSGRFSIRLSILSNQLRMDLAQAVPRVAELLRRIFPFL